MPKIAVVTWQDSFYDDSMHKPEELDCEPEDYTIVSVGWLIRDTDKIITISMDMEGDSKAFREVKRIRKENVRNIRIMEVED
jgi:hypothetical protein